MGIASGDRRRTLVVALAASLAVSTVAVVPAGAATAASVEPTPHAVAPAAAATEADVVRVRFDGTVFSPFVTRVEPGTPLLFVNEGSFPISIEEGSGTFNLSPIPVGGGAAITLSDEVAVSYTETQSGASGRLLFGSASLGAPEAEPVADHIPDAWAPFESDDAYTEDPTDGLRYSTSRLNVRFAPGTTVSEAEAVIARAGAVIIGGNSRVGTLAIAVAGGAGHEAVRAARAQLSAEPTIEIVARTRPGEVDTLPTPVDYPPVFAWPQESLPGVGVSGQEAAGFPQLWNFGEAIRRRDATTATNVTTAVWDMGFDVAHSNVAHMPELEICQVRLRDDSAICTPPSVVNEDNRRNVTHGTHVAGIIGARPSNGRGLQGANPTADMIAFRWAGPAWELLSRVLDLKEQGNPDFADVRLINMSAGWSYNPPGWAEARRTAKCGQGPNDDDTADAIWPCLPWNEDGTVQAAFDDGLLSKPVLQRAASLGVMLVVSAGNSTEPFCISEGELYGQVKDTDGNFVCPEGARPLTNLELGVPSSKINSPFTAANHLWQPSWGPNPVIVVESLANDFEGLSTDRSDYSQTGGTLSAQGAHWSASWTLPDGEPHWEGKSGTSQAAPTVTGIISSMLALDPSMTVTELREAVASFGDTTDPLRGLDVAPRIDALGSMLAVPGGLLALLDVSDQSADGNRRVRYAPGGSIGSYDYTSSTEPGYLTEPDGTVDIRDFRRVRDAWLQLCPPGVSDECANLGSTLVQLDGGDDHPKRDLNFDGCVATSPPSESCPAAESLHPRFDFNGDGTLSRLGIHPVNLDGSLQNLTDLEVFSRLFTPAPAGEGWYADPADVPAMLGRLLVSGDVEVALSGLLGAGVTDVSVTLRDGIGDVFTRPITTSTDNVIITAPAGEAIEIVVKGTKDGQPLEYTESYELAAGEDVRFDPCGVIRLDADDTTIAFEATTAVQATLVSCDTVDLSGVEVLFDLVSAGSSFDATVSSPATTDGSGTAATLVTAGLQAGPYTLTALAAMPTSDGATVPVESSLYIEVEEGYRLETLTSGAAGTFGTNPSITDDGTVVFTGRAAPATPFNEVYRARDGVVTEIGQAARDATDPNIGFGTRAELTGDDDVLLQGSNFTGGGFEQWALEVRASYPTSVRVFGRSNLNTPIDMSGLPTGNGNGDRIMPIHRYGEVGTRIGTYQGGTLAEGPQLAVKWPRHADNGYTIGNANLWQVETATGDPFFSTAIVIGDSNLGIGPDPDQAFLVPLAVENAPDALVPTEWTLLGERPDISPTGDVVAFIGDRGDGPSVYVSVRANDQGSFYPPIAITGPGRSGPPELGYDGSTPRYLSMQPALGEHDLNVGIIHQAAGRTGLDDDIATVVVFGRPDGPGTPFAIGLFSIDVTLSANGTVVPGTARPVVQVGDTQLGTPSAPVERIGWHRVLADDGDSAGPADHQLVFWVDTGATERIVRANWVGDGGTAGGPAPFAAPFAARAAPSAFAAPMPALLAADPPTIPAVVVSDLTPEVGEVITITNRTPLRSQYDTGWLLFEFPDGQRWSPRSGASQQVQPPAGEYTVEFSAGGGYSTFVPLVVSPTPGVPPTADPGGPYLIESGDQLVLDASDSSDADGTIVLYEWDLDRDGEFDDATGPSPRVDYADVEYLLCNGLCSNPPGGGTDSEGIDLRVTDDAGYTDVTAGAVNIDVVVQDFTISLLPATELINPGGQTNLRVDIGSVGGFSGRVSLELISPIPDGYTILLDRWVDAPDSANLLVRAPADAPEETFDIQVRGTSGALVHETSASAEAVFGLIPICYGSVTGVVTDAVTGLPVADMPMRLQGLGSTRYSTTAADGTYTYADIQELRSFTVGAYPTDFYFGSTKNGQIRCDDPLTIDLEVVPIQTTIVRGQVVEGVPDPTDTSRGRVISATSSMIPDPTVIVANRYTIGDADGRYRADIELGQPDNRGFLANVTGDAPGFWRRTIEDVRIQAGPAVTVDVSLVRACTTQVGAHGRVVDQFGNPMPARTVRLYGSGGPTDGYPHIGGRQLGTAVTDDDGFYAIPVAETYLDFQNSGYRFEISTNYGYTVREYFVFDQCDTTFDAEADLEVNVPDPTEPVTHYATVTGRVVDAVTGVPIEYAQVSGIRTGPDGRFTKSNIYVGVDQYTIRTNLSLPVRAPYEWYDETVMGITVAKDTVTDVGDIALVPAEFAKVEGYVIDILTGEPLQYARVTVNPDFGSPNTFLLSTDETGYFQRERMKLPAYNEPRTARIEAIRTVQGGKYFRELGGEIPLVPGETTRTDFALTKICEDVTIRGYVVDAVTGDPIQGASVDTPVTSAQSTDEFGFYEFTGLSAGSYNQPGAYLLTASATGYYTQQKLVAVACGSVITVNFGVDTGTGAVFGTVTDHLGNSVLDAQVIAETGDTDTADADGAYRIEDIPLGLDGQPTEWDFTAVHPDGRTIVLPATVTDGGETQLDFVFPEPTDPPNVAPVSYDRSAFVIGGESVDITLVGTDADGDDLTFDVVTQPSIGSLSGTAPDLAYLAPLDGDGDVTFTYTVSDAEATSAPATVTVTIEPPNRPPAADDLSASVVAGESVDITLTGSDLDGDPLTFEVVTQPAVGTLTGTEPDLTYEAPSDFAGEVTFTYTAFDGEDTSPPATVTVMVEEPPAFASVYGTVTDQSGAPIPGAVVVSDAIPEPGFVEPDGQYFIPGITVPPSGDPIEVFFTALHPDGRGITAPAILIVDTATELNFVFGSVGGPNTPPTADDLLLEVVAGDSVDVTLSGDDDDGDVLEYEVLSRPAVGLLTGVAPDLTYLASADVLGEVSFTYAAFDGEDLSLPATVTITVLPPPDTPPTLAAIGDVTIDEGDSLQIGVTAADVDGHSISLSSPSAPSWVGFVDAGGGSGIFTLEPRDDAVETVQVEACANGLCATTSFGVTVSNVDPTLTIEAPISTVVGTTASVTGAATDPGDDEFSYQVDCGSGFGPLGPDPQFDCTLDTVGFATVSMRVVDDDGGEGTASTVIEVTAAPEISVSASNDGPAPWGTDVVLTAIPEASGLTEPVVYRWDVDGDGTYDNAPSPDATLVTQYAVPGSWSATVEACSGDLCVTASTVVEVVRRPSALSTPVGGPVQYSDNTSVETTLTDGLDANPLAGRDVTVGVDGVLSGALSDGTGVAAVTWSAPVEAGAVPLAASFDGDDLYEPADTAGELVVEPEDAVLDWLTRPATPAENYDVAVMVSESPDGALGDIELASVTFWLDEGCDGDPVPAGTFPIVDGDSVGDGIGEVAATIPGLAGPGCVGAELTSGDAGPSGYYTADPIEAIVADLTDAHVTGGGRFDTSEGWVSVGFVARRRDGVLSGHVEVVEHTNGVVQHRSIALTGLTIVDEGRAGFVATITAEFLERSSDDWIDSTFTLIARDGGRGRGADSVWWEGGPPRVDGSFRGQVVVHR